MAQTDDDPNIWRLLADEHSFIAGLVNNSEKLANELVRSFLEEGETDRDGRVRYRVWQIRALPGGAPSPYDGAFWQSDPERGVHCEIDHRNSSAYWTGPTSADWKAFGRETAEYQVIMIRLNHPVVLDFLTGVGLLPPVEQPASELTIEPAAAPVIEQIASKQPQTVGPVVAAESADTAAVTGAVRSPSAETIPRKVWLRAAKRERPQQKNETNPAWAEEMIKRMQVAKDAGRVDRVWSQTTMERRLRDKDKDDDESYQVGN